MFDHTHFLRRNRKATLLLIFAITAGTVAGALFIAQALLISEIMDRIFLHGRIVALVGSTGAGKSTIASILLRFIEPSSGAVSIGDTPFLIMDEATSHLDTESETPIVVALQTLMQG